MHAANMDGPGIMHACAVPGLAARGGTETAKKRAKAPLKRKPLWSSIAAYHEEDAAERVLRNVQNKQG